MLKPYKFQSEIIDRFTGANSTALFMDMGCISGDSTIKINRGGCSRQYSFREAFYAFNNSWDRKIPTRIRSFDGETIKLNDVIDIKFSGIKPVYEITLENGFKLEATAEHKVKSKRAWIRTDKLMSNGGASVMVDVLSKHQKKETPNKKQKKIRYNLSRVGMYHPYGRLTERKSRNEVYYVIEKHRAMYEAYINGLSLIEFQEKTKVKNNLKFIDPKKFHIHHKDHNSKNDTLENLEMLSVKDHLAHHGNYNHFGHGKPEYSKVVSVKRIGVKDTYDIECKKPHSNFVVNGIVVHNSGKTCVSINLLTRLAIESGDIPPTVIFCPVIVLQNWKDEFLKFSTIPESSIGIVQGTKAKRIKTISDRKYKILIINYEALRSKPVCEALFYRSPRVIILDESQRIKSRTTAQFKEIIKLAKFSSHRMILSGTPMPNGFEDLWSQYYFLDRGDTLGVNFFSFRNKYFQNNNRAWTGPNAYPDWVLIPSKEPEIQDLISKTSVRIKAEDCIDLPDLVDVPVKVEFSPEQRKHYDEIKKDLITWLDDQEEDPLIVRNALTKVLRLNEIGTGYMKLESGDVYRFASNPRLDALIELIKDTAPHKVIVFCVFKENYEAIGKALQVSKIPYVELHGGISAQGKQVNVERFTADDKIRVCIANPKSAGLGVNLQAARFAIYWSRSFSAEDYEQSRRRNYRAGSLELHKKITHYHFYTPGSIDERIKEAVDKKRNLSKSLIDMRRELEI